MAATNIACVRDRDREREREREDVFMNAIAILRLAQSARPPGPFVLADELLEGIKWSN